MRIIEKFKKEYGELWKEKYNEWFRAYQKSPERRKYRREYQRVWRKKHSTYNDNARRPVSYGVKKGTIKKLPCEVCGNLEVEAHHSDYSKRLEVKWLCRKHHVEIDVKEGKRYQRRDTHALQSSENTPRNVVG